MMEHVFLLTLVTTALAARADPDKAERLTGEALVDYVNSLQHQWTVRFSVITAYAQCCFRRKLYLGTRGSY